MRNIRLEVLSLINNAIEKSGIDYIATHENIEKPPKPEMGDLSSNIPFVLSKTLKRNPMDIANDIIKNIDTNKIIAKVEAVKPGFINVKIQPNIYIENLMKIIDEGTNYGKSRLETPKRVLIDYSSPNIAKSFSVGHLRSTIIGQALYNIYRAIGWEVVGDNHIGDWGTQFGMIIAEVREKNTDMEKLSIKDLENIYVTFNKKVKENPDLQELARSAFADLERGEKTAVQIWKKSVEISMKEFQRIYDILDIHIDYHFGESHYSSMMENIIEECRNKGIAKESRGALIVELENLPPAMLLKSNGTTTYLTRDLAAIKFREDTHYLKSQLYIYEVGAPQTTHFKQLFAVAELLGLGKDAQFVHVAHGLMHGPGGSKMSTRKGNTIKLDDLLSKAKEKAIDMMKRKTGNNLDETLLNNAEKIGIGAIKYNELKRAPKTDYTFEWDEALAMDGNTAPYIQYTQRRAESVLEKAETFPNKTSENTTQHISQEELHISKLLYDFNNVLQLAADTFSPNKLVSYIFEVAQAYNSFYNSDRIIGSPKQDFKLQITKATSIVLANGLEILGITTVNKM